MNGISLKSPHQIRAVVSTSGEEAPPRVCAHSWYLLGFSSENCVPLPRVAGSEQLKSFICSTGVTEQAEAKFDL